MDDLLKSFTDVETEFAPDFSLAKSSTFNVGGKARLAVFPDTPDKLIAAADTAKRFGVKYEIIGNGSNIIFPDGFYDGVIIFTKNLNKISAENNRLFCFCGATLTSAALAAKELSLSGLEFAYGIPGSAGGAAVMNAGAYGGQISDILASSEYYDSEARTRRKITLSEHGYGYRDSIFLRDKNLILLCCEFELKAGNPEKIKEKMNSNMNSRRENQPLEYPSAGSFFKRPPGYFAGKLIEDCGLKGLSVGGAAVSEKHAGFIINKGKATAQDILTLVEKIKKAVFEKFGVTLESEVRIIK